HADYTIGWICALPKEQTAAIAMLDREHPDLPPPDNDDNVYTLGSIGGHNVVITCLPKGRYGTNSAATVAKNMIGSFPSIKFELLVGIGGGIPSKVRLGDVVVSAPTDQYPGVVQWDLGKAEDGGKFRRIGALNSPPNALLKVLSKLESENEMQGSKIPGFLDEMKQKWPKLYPKYFWNASLRDPQGKGSEGAANTTADSAIDEPRMRCPDIHYGLIASGNQVIKDATVRDCLDGDLDGNVLCIEMEAAGLMNNFPCLVVRGICDYADSSKNKDWQEYAAAVAAACAKEILSVLPVQVVKRMGSVKDILWSINAELGIIRTTCSEIVSRQDNKAYTDFLESLTPVDYTLQQKDSFSKWQPGTCQWLLSSGIYRDWVDTSQQTLFCPGIPGAGKTILTSVIINNLYERLKKGSKVGIAYLYCNFWQHAKQELYDLLISLVKQLALGIDDLPKDAKKIIDDYKANKQRPSLDAIKNLLQYIAASYSRVFILIDALDECQESGGCRTNLLDEIFFLQEREKVNIFATSRFIPEITEKFRDCKCIKIRAIKEDVQIYVQDQLKRGHMEHLPSLIESKPALKDAIIREISDAVDGMFLLAKIYLDTLVDKVTIADVRMAVAQLPKQMAGSGESQRLKVVNQAYELAWERINGQQEGFRDIATRVLAWIACAKRPLHTWELQHALAVKVGMKEIDKDAIPQVHDMISFCAGLVTIDEESNVIRPVHYTTQEYIKTKKSDWFPNPEIMITETCITYLSFTAFEKCFLDRSRLHYLLRSHDFYLYASRFWGEHTRLVGKELDKNVLEFLMNEVKIFNAYHAMQQQQPGEYRDLEAFPAKFSLHHAVHFGFDKAINLLLKKGSIINNHKAVAEILLDNGANIEAKDCKGNTPLQIAVQISNIEAADLLLNMGANVEAADPKGNTPLHIAARRFYGELVRLLLQKGADIEARNGNGDKPLHIAVQNSSIKAVDLLLNMGANVEAADPKGYTPLHIAVQNSSIEAADLLLNMGANVEAVDPEGYTPLHIAAQDLDVALIELLLKNGASTEALDNEGRTPLFAVILSLCREHCIEADVDVLLEYEANVDVLLKYEAKMEAIDNEGCTVLISVVEKGDIRVSEFLIQKGACIE
ncbi:uncharacterized protein TRIVIDRAFT_132430, partial [Trichoderma virens Gv29-8]